MKNIIFICHGCICRSPAAEFIAKKYLKELNRNEEFNIFSRAVSLEEIGNDIYPPMKKTLTLLGIPFSHHSAKRITEQELREADYIFYMDLSNKNYLFRLYGNLANKCLPIFQFSKDIFEIEDPWYTDRYDKVAGQIMTCIKDIFNNI